MLKQKRFFLSPLLIWTVIILGSILIAQDAVKRGYISIDLSRNVETTSIPTPSFIPKQTETPNPQPTKTPIPSPSQIVIPQTNQPTFTPKPTIGNLPVLSGANIFYFINNYRQQKGLPQLQLSNELCTLAQQRVDFLIKEDPSGEKSFIGNHYKFQEMLYDVYSGNTIGENLSGNKKGDVEVVEGWKKSPPHNELLLGTHSPNGTVYTNGCVRTAVSSDNKYNQAVFLIGDK